MLEESHCFASSGDDGSLHVVRVHVNTAGSLPKYGKLLTVREHRVDHPGEFITSMHHFNTGEFLFFEFTTALLTTFLHLS
jgi:phosphoinositide-3-kinase regulatory subunit 4